MVDEDGFGPSDIESLAHVSRETLERIERVIGTLKEWSTRLNLIGRNEWRHLWRRHVWDSAQLLDHVSRDSNVVDLGSGAGFPALILASALTAEGNGKVSLIEKSPKKATFLREAIKAADLRAEVYGCRIEDAPVITADIVTARAFAPLPRLMVSASQWLERDATALLHKGQKWKEELTAASETWKFTSEAIQSRSGGSGVILKVWGVQRVS